MYEALISGLLIAAVSLLWNLNSKLAALNQLCKDMKERFDSLPCQNINHKIL